MGVLTGESAGYGYTDYACADDGGLDVVLGCEGGGSGEHECRGKGAVAYGSGVLDRGGESVDMMLCDVVAFIPALFHSSQTSTSSRDLPC